MAWHLRKASLGAALWAGLIAILINTVLLHMADFIPLQTAHGGLLNLLDLAFGTTLVKLGVASVWRVLGLPTPDGAIFRTGFHVLVGLGMAIVYAFIIEPRLPGPAWVKGLMYALALWLLNTLLILPLIGEGIAGSKHLSDAGMAYYAATHTVFFVLLALLYALFSPSRVQQSLRYR
ncbi:hypothetical protein [Glaciimonas immobilis]|uniref:Putative membrane protein YagU involved in acid resistance n=1 Tax=Glaciimonas immobilis TaxID=728004 RepID=A0A840RSJ5_9BURK|nr:hypothetical protein [Glaciimonas immobilis]KAF3999688.1 hypothetical protein HAV38_00355 [Glaciimonas immobilis]MBB5200132.1 putative membrane protein YagU involved in acid resistance [Glaciimonas immobilis]